MIRKININGLFPLHGGEQILDQVIQRCGKRRTWREQTVFPVTTTASGETSATVAALCARKQV